MAYSKLTKEKTKEKEKADALAKQSANVSSKPNVTEKKKKVKKNASGNRALVMESSVRTLGIKCYEEQFPKGWADVCALIRKIDKKRYQVIGIKHDKDPDLGDKWGASTEKAHYHIYIRVLGNSSVKVRTLLNLVGCVYRPGLDDSLWDEHGVETLGSFSASAMYATHETPQAILDGKTPYPFEELVSNLTTDELKQVRDGYVRVTDTKTKLTIEELNDLDKEAYKLGYELKDFEEWYHAHPLAVRKQSTVKQFKESYNYGVKVRVSEMHSIVRCCIFISGAGNLGKSYAAKLALSGYKILPIDGGGTGKFDDLTPSHQAIVMDDYFCSNLLNLSDNKPAKAYRRGSGTPYWCGEYFVVTSNLSFKEWATECGQKFEKVDKDTGRTVDNGTYKPLESRWFICHIDIDENGQKYLHCDKPATRGKAEEQLARKELYVKFRDNYNPIIADYVPQPNEVDYDDLNPVTKEISAKREKARRDMQAEKERIEDDAFGRFLIQNRMSPDDFLKFREDLQTMTKKQIAEMYDYRYDNVKNCGGTIIAAANRYAEKQKERAELLRQGTLDFDKKKGSE